MRPISLLALYGVVLFLSAATPAASEGTYTHVYAIDVQGTVVSLDETFNVLLKGKGGRKGCQQATLSADRKELLIGFATFDAPLDIVDTKSLQAEAVQFQCDPEHGPRLDHLLHDVVQVLPVTRDIIVVEDFAYWEGERPYLLQVDLPAHKCELLPDVLLPADDRIWISPTRDRVVCLHEGIALFDLSSRKAKTLIKFNEFWDSDTATPGRVNVYGADFDWQAMVMDLWWKRINDHGEPVIERVWADLNKQEIVPSQGVSPWPSRPFMEGTRAFQVLDTYKRCHLHFSLPPTGRFTVLRPWEAKVFTQLPKKTLDLCPKEPAYTTLSPDGKYLFSVAVGKEGSKIPSKDGDTEDEDSEHSILKIINVKEQCVVKAIPSNRWWMKVLFD